MKLNVQAIFSSIDGEENAFGGAGELTTFIRLKGCNLRCTYCDTKYAQAVTQPNWMTADEVFKQVHFPKVTITGGEPMLQWRQLGLLVEKLLHKDCKITIETNGSVLLPPWLYGHEFNWVWTHTKGLRYVVDYKLPSSGMEDKMNLETFKNLCPLDVIKFVIEDEKDYKCAKMLLQEYDWDAKRIFSPQLPLWYGDYTNPMNIAVAKMERKPPAQRFTWASKLAEMMIKDRVPAQFGLQLHKVLWPAASEER